MSNVRIRNRRSEPGCAQAMRVIAADIKAGLNRLEDRPYLAVEVAERYGVHPKTAYRGMRVGDPLFPTPTREGTGARPRLSISRAEIEACDQRRLTYYRLTPSWLPPTDARRPEKSARVAARKLFPEK